MNTCNFGDCLEVMPSMDEASIDSVVTDPPYGLNFMGKDWDHGVPGMHFWVEALRVAKPGAYLLAFGGTRTYHRLTCAIEDAGWEIRDCLQYIPRNDPGSAARFFYLAKASKKDRNEGCEGLPEKISGMVSDTSGQHITRRDGNAPGPRANHHPTVKPTELMRYLCRLVTPPGGLILDPFMGSGSTGKAARLEGFGFVGIEKNAEYVEIARARINAGQTGMVLS